jgi:antitoxin component of MazEF toxin-antitoxin module
MKQKLIKVGNSLMVVIPASFIQTVGAKNKDTVMVLANSSKAEVRVKFSSINQLTLGDDFFSLTKRK